MGIIWVVIAVVLIVLVVGGLSQVASRERNRFYGTYPNHQAPMESNGCRHPEIRQPKFRKGNVKTKKRR